MLKRRMTFGMARKALAVTLTSVMVAVFAPASSGGVLTVRAEL